jgi:hypothetical protein
MMPCSCIPSILLSSNTSDDAIAIKFHTLTHAPGKLIFSMDAHAQGGSSKAALAREAALALDLDHPNVLSCFARVTDDEGETIGMAMELLKGDDLLEELS